MLTTAKYILFLIVFAFVSFWFFLVKGLIEVVKDWTTGIAGLFHLLFMQDDK